MKLIANKKNNDYDKLMNSFLNKDILKFSNLIDSGYDANSLSDDGKSFISKMLEYPSDNTNKEFLNILLNSGMSLKQHGIERGLLSISIRNQSKIDYLKKLLESNINVNTFGVYKGRLDGMSWPDCPPIFHAIVKGDIQFIDLLLKYDIDFDIENSEGETPLNYLIDTYCTYHRKPELLPSICEKFLNHGANPNAIGEMGRQSIHVLSFHYHNDDLFEILYKHNNEIDINAKDFYGNTALKICACEGNFKGLKFLINHGGDSNIINRYKTSALMMSVHSNSLEIFEYLLSHGASVLVCNNDNNNILHFLAKNMVIHKKSKFEKYFNEISKSHPELLVIKNKNGDTPLNILKNKNNYFFRLLH